MTSQSVGPDEYYLLLSREALLGVGCLISTAQSSNANSMLKRPGSFVSLSYTLIGHRIDEVARIGMYRPDPRDRCCDGKGERECVHYEPTAGGEKFLGPITKVHILYL